MKKLKIISAVFLVILLASFSFGFTGKYGLAEKSYKLLKKELINGETIKRLNYDKFLSLKSYDGVFYIDEKGYLEPVDKNYIFSKKKHIVFKILKNNKTTFNEKQSYAEIHDVKRDYLSKIYNKDYEFEKIETKNIKQFSKNNTSITDNNYNDNLDVIRDLYSIGRYHKPESSYGGCGPVAEYIALQYFINAYVFESLLQKRAFRNRNISYLSETNSRYNENKSEKFIERLKLADFIYENTYTKTGSDSNSTETWSSHMIAGIYKTLEALGLENVISANRTNIFQQRVWRIKNNVLHGFPSLVWTYNQNIAENNHWFVTQGYEVWKIKNKKTNENFNLTFLQITDNSRNGKIRYVDENKLTGIWGMIEIKAANNKFFYNDEFRLVKNKYDSNTRSTIMKNRLGEELEAEYIRAGYIQSYYSPGAENGMFNTLSGNKNNESTDYVRLLADNKEIHRFDLNSLYEDRYMLDLKPFMMKFNYKVYKITLEVFKKSSYKGWNRGRVVIDNLIINK